MRELVDSARIRDFMRAFGREAEAEARVYFTGGVTAVLSGWRATTIDIDIKLVPESDRLFRAIPSLKESLHVNVELASPAEFIPELPGWQERSAFVAREGRVSFHHYDFYAQALAKLERGHAQDSEDVRQMANRALIERPRLLELFRAIEPELYRFPAIDPPSFRGAVEEFAAAAG
jgi:hypothetical protein